MWISDTRDYLVKDTRDYKRNWVSHHEIDIQLYLILIHFCNKEMVIVVMEINLSRIISRVKTKQGMKQLEYHKVMNPQFLFLLISNIAILVRLKRGHNAGFKLTTKLGGRGPKLVQLTTPSPDITSLLVHKIFVDPCFTMLKAKLD